MSLRTGPLRMGTPLGSLRRCMESVAEMTARREPAGEEDDSQKSHSAIGTSRIRFQPVGEPVCAPAIITVDFVDKDLKVVNQMQMTIMAPPNDACRRARAWRRR